MAVQRVGGLSPDPDDLCCVSFPNSSCGSTVLSIKKPQNNSYIYLFVALLTMVCRLRRVATPCGDAIQDAHAVTMANREKVDKMQPIV